MRWRQRATHAFPPSCWSSPSERSFERRGSGECGGHSAGGGERQPRSCLHQYFPSLRAAMGRPGGLPASDVRQNVKTKRTGAAPDHLAVARFWVRDTHVYVCVTGQLRRTVSLGSSLMAARPFSVPTEGGPAPRAVASWQRDAVHLWGWDGVQTMPAMWLYGHLPGPSSLTFVSMSASIFCVLERGGCVDQDPIETRACLERLASQSDT